MEKIWVYEDAMNGELELFRNKSDAVLYLCYNHDIDDMLEDSCEGTEYLEWTEDEWIQFGLDNGIVIAECRVREDVRG